MDCPHCKVPLMGGMKICPKCKYDTSTSDGGMAHKKWIEEQKAKTIQQKRQTQTTAPPKNKRINAKDLLVTVINYLLIALCVASVPIGLIFASDVIGGYNPDISDHPPYDRDFREHTCQFPSCEEKANHELECTVLSDSGSRIEHRRLIYAAGIKNKANFSFSGDGISGTMKDGGYFVVSSNKYLVPQNDGSWKIEKRTNLEHRDRTRAYSLSVLKIQGYYCEEHAPVASRTLKAELETQFLWKNWTFWLGPVAFPTLLAAIIIFRRKVA